MIVNAWQSTSISVRMSWIVEIWQFPNLPLIHIQWAFLFPQCFKMAPGDRANFSSAIRAVLLEQRAKGRTRSCHPWTGSSSSWQFSPLPIYARGILPGLIESITHCAFLLLDKWREPASQRLPLIPFWPGDACWDTRMVCANGKFSFRQTGTV